MGTARRLLLVFCATLPLISCARNDPPGIRAPAPASTQGVRINASLPTTPGANDAAVPLPPEDARAPRPASTAGNITPLSSVPQRQTTELPREASLVDDSGHPLPQTNDRPALNSPSFQQRIARLCQAIIEGAPEKAHDAFFPLVAYSQVKAVADPGRDYRLRLLAHFDRDILEYHHRIARRPGPYRCAGITVPENLARWMKPGSEYNKLGYFRVLRSQLRILDAAEKATSFEVTSLISWRGEWYVVHLDGFE